MKWIVLVLPFLVAVAPAHATSFDCHKAVTQVEKLICSNPALSKLDDQMGATYKAALQDKPHAAVTKRMQRQWLTELKHCQDADCIKEAYEIQLAMYRLPVVTVPVGSPHFSRSKHSATLLPNGQVLIAGGLQVKNNPNQIAELYDPASRQFTLTGQLATGQRADHKATLLPNGQVLITGGSNVTGRSYSSKSSGELYDPGSGKFRAFGGYDLSSNFRNGPALLSDGRLLFLGWEDQDYVYDPSNGNKIMIERLYDESGLSNMTRLQDGKVLIADSYVGDDLHPSMAELFDPATNRFSPTGWLHAPRTGNTATLLPDGKVLFAGGVTMGETMVPGIELYDPVSGKFTAAGSLVMPRDSHHAILLKSGKVLFCGGEGASSKKYLSSNVASLTLHSIELYDPASKHSRIIGRFFASAAGFSATLLKSGKVLFVSGDIAELYDPADGGE